MHFIYIDDSGDEKLHIFSALTISVNKWNPCFEQIKRFRYELKMRDSIFVETEFHASEFVAGRGRIANDVVTKGRRCEIFKQTLQMITMLPEVRLFNTVFPAKTDKSAYEALLRGINRALQQWDSYAILICDEGKEDIYTRLVRRMQTSQNGAIDHIVEDPFFKRSDQSYFIQLSDFCAYALLRQERPIESKTRYGLDRAFNLLNPIVERIIRPNS